MHSILWIVCVGLLDIMLYILFESCSMTNILHLNELVVFNMKRDAKSYAVDIYIFYLFPTIICVSGLCCKARVLVLCVLCRY